MLIQGHWRECRPERHVNFARECRHLLSLQTFCHLASAKPVLWEQQQTAGHTCEQHARPSEGTSPPKRESSRRATGQADISSITPCSPRRATLVVVFSPAPPAAWQRWASGPSDRCPHFTSSVHPAISKASVHLPVRHDLRVEGGDTN